MGTIRIDQTTYIQGSSIVIQITANAFQCNLFGCEEVFLEAIDDSGNVHTIGQVTSGRVYNWNPSSLALGRYRIKGTGLASGQVAFSEDCASIPCRPDYLTVISSGGGEVQGELLEALLKPANVAVNQNFHAEALIQNTGLIAGQYYINAVYVNAGGALINAKASTRRTLQPAETWNASTPNMLATVGGKVFVELRVWPATTTIDLRTIDFVPTGGTPSAKVVINFATVPSTVTKNKAFTIPVNVSEINGLSGTYRLIPLINSVRQSPSSYTISGGQTQTKNPTFTLGGNATIAFSVETFINSVWVPTGSAIGRSVTVVDPPLPPPPPPTGPPVGPPPPPPPGPIVLPNIPIEYIIIGGVVTIIAGVLLLPAKARA